MINLRSPAPRAWAAALLLATALPALAAPDIQAAKRVLDSAPVCQNLGDYYWEIGDAKGVIASGSKGTRVQARNPLPIASASKWIFGAFVAESTKGHLSPAQVQALEMGSGFDSFNPFFCRGAKNIEECLGRRNNGHQDPAKVGVFNYNEGHDAKLAVDLGLGQLDLQSLALTWNATLNSGNDIHFLSPEPAGGLSMSPAAYGDFLRRLLGGKLQLSRYLGYQPVCTDAASCPGKAAHSPVPRAWHYSLNHWVEDDPQGDGAFSSAGAFGFYPWISADKRYYGIFARLAIQPKSGVVSANCGIAMRAALFHTPTPAPMDVSDPENGGRGKHPLLDRLRERRERTPAAPN